MTTRFLPFKVIFITFSFVVMSLNSCIQNQSVSSKRKSSAAQSTGTGNGGSGDGTGATPGDGTVGGNTNIVIAPKQEIRHIVDPFSGSYSTKVTIPKNYKGMLYISGINISSLSDKIVKVRFRFGREKQEIIIPAAITRGESGGITPDTDIQVLSLDLTSQPFNNIRLLYDLFDYTDYDTNDDGVEFGTGDTVSTPESNPRAAGVYCRGLKLEDDPTFQISSTNDKCDTAGEKCHYAYARILDSGLYFNSSGNMITNTLTEPAIDLNKTGYANESQAERLKKCLPDTNHRSSNEMMMQTNYSGSNASILSYGNTAFGGAYEYRGPYRSVDRLNWEIGGGALFSDVSTGSEGLGLFQASIANAPTPTITDPNQMADGGVKSFLFPRAGKMNLTANVEYIGFTDLTDPLGFVDSNAARSIKSLVSSGPTEYMDGCNMRVTNYDVATNEGITSCTVSASIDIITEVDGEIQTLTTSKAIKLQIVRPSTTDYEGNEVLYSALNSCTNSQACGSNECCFNKRCWSKDLVSQCLDDVDGQGNYPVGQSCASDFQCSSLCCNPSTRACAVHSSELGILCNKPTNLSCVTREFCREEPVPTCFIVKTKINQQTGAQECDRRCYSVPTLGNCIDGICRQPPTPDVPPFDPNSPDACNGAIDPPVNL